ncbi:UPF0175 family protein [Gloeocapsa sp. PCC 73106]|uniref:UPF0175 family protein n=1 Tax=Gloeocapsa sp. PCC 73106 TaxID=102232 RepID=UPI0002ABEFE3|nr:UPF0175 family protein [Gloeocapsa sp. PCC 73106]ELR96835.1 uncharacterized small protein [Gloeocapsa sp. PCC 73106]
MTHFSLSLLLASKPICLKVVNLENMIDKTIEAMSIVISDEIVQASHLTPDEFRHEIALHLFQIGRLTLGYASRLAQMQV